MFILLTVSKARANKGILHVRRNGDQKLLKKDAILVSEHNGKKYAFFIIECEENDQLRCGEASLVVKNSRSEREILNDAVHVSKMCEELLKQKKPLPENIENLLADYLSYFFSRPIQWESNNFDSATIWLYYEWILETLDKNANDFVDQSDIDNFFKKMCDIYDIWQISKFLPSNVLTVSQDVSKAIEQSKQYVQETIEIAKGLIAEKNYRDIECSFGDTPSILIYAEDTPCGNISILIDLTYEFSVLLTINSYPKCKLGITSECREFEKNFKRGH